MDKRHFFPPDPVPLFHFFFVNLPLAEAWKEPHAYPAHTAPTAHTQSACLHVNIVPTFSQEKSERHRYILEVHFYSTSILKVQKKSSKKSSQKYY